MSVGFRCGGCASNRPDRSYSITFHQSDFGTRTRTHLDGCLLLISTFLLYVQVKLTGHISIVLGNALMTYLVQFSYGHIFNMSCCMASVSDWVVDPEC